MTEARDSRNVEPPPGGGKGWRRRILPALVLVAAVAYAASGVYVVRPSEKGIVRRFGKVVSTRVEDGRAPKILSPGPHYRLPSPITRLDRVRPDETKTVTVGFERVDELLGRAADPQRAEFLTGDQNIMQLRLTIQYVINDPLAFLFGSTSPETVLKAEVGACLARAVAELGVDELIGAGRVGVSARVRAELDREIRLHGLGLRVSAVSFQAPTPPKEVAAAFNEVQSAKAERHRLVLEAQGYRNGRVTRAAGEAGKLRREAEAYAERRVAEAEGEGKRFEDLHEEYRQAKGVTQWRLYVEAMEEILPRMKKVFVDADEEGSPIDLGLYHVRRGIGEAGE
jgi:membrane protease subunit HflK